MVGLEKEMNQKAFFIPFGETFSVGAGGPATFMRNLEKYLDRVGYSYSKNSKDASGIFFPVVFNTEILNRIRRRNGVAIQRLDGIYYPSKHGAGYLELNSRIQDIYSTYTTYVIFQSEYSKKQCFLMLGKKGISDYEIILNGADKEIFFPRRKKEHDSSKLRIVTTGHFRNKDMIEPVVMALDLLKTSYNFELTIIGPITNSTISHYFSRDYIKHIDIVDINEVAEFLRTCDIFIYSHLNPPCPNSVVEAISCGLPVVGFDSGAMSELLFFAKDLLAAVSDDILQKYEDFDYVLLAEKLAYSMGNYSFCAERAFEYSHLYSFDECGSKYLEIFERLRNSLSDRNIIKKLFQMFKSASF